MPAKLKKNKAKEVSAAAARAERPVASRVPEQGATSAVPILVASPSRCKPWYAWVLLSGLVLAALLPVSNRAFHIDDTLFVFAGKHIAQDPLNPYGFVVNWDDFDLPFSQITRNPPLACYYIAAAGKLAGFSERSLHVAFLLPALGFVLLTFYLARRFTKMPLVAALATLAAPAYLVSSASVMCDGMLVAIWLPAVILWLEGLERRKPWMLALSGVLMGTAAVTKYFGVSLIPLLLAYTLYREWRLSRSLAYLLIPVAMLAAYQLWTKSLYGEGLLLSAADFANTQKENVSFAAETIEGLSFVGGCMFPAVAFAPWLWSKRQIAVTLVASALATALVVTGVVFTGRASEEVAVGVSAFHAHAIFFSAELTLFVAGGISALALAISDFWKRRDANSLLLMLWVLGTFAFTCYFNWTVNARAVLPLLPAVAILIARRLRARSAEGVAHFPVRLAAPLLVSGALAVWVMIGDSQLANSARTAIYRAKELASAQPANRPTDQIAPAQGKLWFIGHWGLQYYGEQAGAFPANRLTNQMKVGDYILTAENNTASKVRVSGAAPRQQLEFPGPSGAITINRAVGAGFYSSYWGPLPFFLGPIPPERYTLIHLVETAIW